MRDEKKAIAGKLLTVAALHEGFVANFGEKIPLAEFIVHLKRLEASDTLGLLIFRSTGAEPHPEDLVLLDPTRVDAYSSALLVAAKDEPDGPGHLLESRVREGKFKLAKEERIADRKSERHVLSYVMEKLLARDLALRERIKGKDYLVFPSQCTAELRFPGAAAFGVTFGFAGPVRDIYARLIAHLAHYEGFRKREFFQDAAAYHAQAGGRCLVHLRDHANGQGELEVFYDKETPASVRQGFLEFVGKLLWAKSSPGSVTMRHAYHCSNVKCRNPFEDRVVKARLEAGRKTLLCPICEKKTPLVDLLAPPTAVAEAVAEQIGTDAKAGRQRMTAAFVIKAKEAEGKFDVFLSHNAKDKAAVEKIAKRLKGKGLRPWLDKWNLSGGDTLEDALEQAIKTISCAALCFGPADVSDWHIMEIRAYVAAWAKKKARMIPVILPGVETVPELPLFVRQTLWVDMRDWERAESDAFYQLVCGILGKAPGDSQMKKFGVRDVAEWQGAGM
ncbi:MAG TPA: toll/interleukin-1 receptor domain-containing protein [Pyrinomonadaceae bacterium]|nr:toll/interleukin-1 receptor domain-containing protein [Pyrinomonadaceae bacterium]